MKKGAKIHVEADFEEIGSKTVDERHRLVLGGLKDLPEIKRVKVYINSQNEILIRPMVEIPASEVWLYKNKKALASVMKGLEEAGKGEVEELDLDSLD